MSKRMVAVAAALALAPWGAARAERYLIELRDWTEGRKAVAGAGGAVLRELQPQRAVAARLPEEAVERLRLNPHVAFIERDPERYPSAQSTPWGISMVQAPLVWSSATGSGRKVCVIDSGLWVGHQDLQTTSVTGHPSSWNQDGCGHGTHVTGTIAALNNSTGVVGVLPNGVSLHVVRVFNDACNWAYASDLVDALNRCRSAGANVVNMSLGGRFASQTERRAFDDAWSAGLLSVAAAGNAGNTRYSYPASYDSVISVGAVDAARELASFSQRNDQVELVAPGVEVPSTVSWIDENSLTVGGARYDANWIEGGARTAGTDGALADGGLCTSSGSWAGKVVLCRRGSTSFRDKVNAVIAGGGVAAVVYNDQPGNFSGTLGNGPQSAIPAISLSQQDGQALVAGALGQSGRVVSLYQNPGSGYASWSGTSMATPHVAGVAALVWSYDGSWTNAQVRQALQATAEDLGASGRDDSYGHGLVRARAALDHLVAGGGGGGGPAPGPPPSEIILSATGSKQKGVRSAQLAWSGASGPAVDVYRDGAIISTGPNDGSHVDELGRGGGTVTYQVCEAGTSTCSNPAAVQF